MELNVVVPWQGFRFEYVDLSLMEYGATSWGAELIVLSGAGPRWRETHLFAGVDELKAAYPGANWVLLVPEDTVPGGVDYDLLHDFTHPDVAATDVNYVIGSDIDGLDLAKYPTGNARVHVVCIDTAKGASHALWGFQCLDVVMYDRFLKIKKAVS